MFLSAMFPYFSTPYEEHTDTYKKSICTITIQNMAVLTTFCTIWLLVSLGFYVAAAHPFDSERRTTHTNRTTCQFAQNLHVCTGINGWYLNISAGQLAELDASATSEGAQNENSACARHTKGKSCWNTQNLLCKLPTNRICFSACVRDAESCWPNQMAITDPELSHCTTNASLFDIMDDSKCTGGLSKHLVAKLRVNWGNTTVKVPPDAWQSENVLAYLAPDVADLVFWNRLDVRTQRFVGDASDLAPSADLLFYHSTEYALVLTRQQFQRFNETIAKTLIIPYLQRWVNDIDNTNTYPSVSFVYNASETAPLEDDATETEPDAPVAGAIFILFFCAAAVAGFCTLVRSSKQLCTAHRARK